jgi:prevent-host-death family protein
MPSTKQVGAYEAKTTLPALLAQVRRGREIVITKHQRPIARLVPVETPVSRDRTVFARIRALRARLSLAKGETAKELINEGRRI